MRKNGAVGRVQLNFVGAVVVVVAATVVVAGYIFGQHSYYIGYQYHIIRRFFVDISSKQRTSTI